VGSVAVPLQGFPVVVEVISQDWPEQAVHFSEVQPPEDSQVAPGRVVLFVEVQLLEDSQVAPGHCWLD
jgi:hypothetical protein